MDVFQLIMRVLSTAIGVYIGIITVWIILGWIMFLGQPNRFTVIEEAHRIVGSFVDPYINLFRRIPLQIGNISFSAMLGILVLVFVRRILQVLGLGSFPTGWFILTLVIELLWGLFAALLSMYAIIMVIRLITLYSMKNSNSNFLDQLDRFLFPRVARMMGRFTKKAVPYPIALGFNTALIILFIVCTSMLLNQVLFPFLESL